MEAGESKNSDDASAALVDRHSEIWQLMGLSREAVAELNRIVVDLSGQLTRDRANRAASSTPLPEAKRADYELTRAEFIDGHRRRFVALGIGRSTQAELLDAAAFVWRALHDASVPKEQREAADTIRAMMQAMGGPPPCCDDNVFDVAALGTPCD